MINNHSNLLKNKFNVNLDDANKHFPQMYRLPKLNNTPSKARFIVADAHCSLKTISKGITSL